MKRNVIQKEKRMSTPIVVQKWQLVPNAKLDLSRLTTSLISLNTQQGNLSRNQEFSFLNFSNQVFDSMFHVFLKQIEIFKKELYAREINGL